MTKSKLKSTDNKLADIYNLTLLNSDISNNKGNKTRFVLISNEKSKISNNDKSSLIFSTHKDQPGSLVDILEWSTPSQDWM